MLENTESLGGWSWDFLPTARLANHSDVLLAHSLLGEYYVRALFCGVLCGHWMNVEAESIVYSNTRTNNILTITFVTNSGPTSNLHNLMETTLHYRNGKKKRLPVPPAFVAANTSAGVYVVRLLIIAVIIGCL